MVLTSTSPFSIRAVFFLLRVEIIRCTSHASIRSKTERKKEIMISVFEWKNGKNSHTHTHKQKLLELKDQNTFYAPLSRNMKSQVRRYETLQQKPLHFVSIARNWRVFILSSSNSQVKWLKKFMSYMSLKEKKTTCTHIYKIIGRNSFVIGLGKMNMAARRFQWW